MLDLTDQGRGSGVEGEGGVGEGGGTFTLQHLLELRAT